MQYLRSTLYYIILILWTLVWPVICLPFAIFSETISRKSIILWSRFAIFMLGPICKLHIRLINFHALPEPPFIIASKHQSGIETWLYSYLFNCPVFILKRELLYIPIWGWYLWSSKMIYIDRNKGSKALQKIATEVDRVFIDNRVLIIFPEGSRIKPGVQVKYKPGIALIHKQHPDIPIIPTKVNSGIYWPKGSFLIKPGVIDIEFKSAIKPLSDQDKLQREQVLAILHDNIES